MNAFIPAAPFSSATPRSRNQPAMSARRPPSLTPALAAATAAAAAAALIVGVESAQAFGLPSLPKLELPSISLPGGDTVRDSESSLLEEAESKVDDLMQRLEAKKSARKSGVDKAANKAAKAAIQDANTELQEAVKAVIEGE